MSIGYASKRLGSDRTLSAAAAATQTVYERPSEWLNLPTLAPTDNKLVGLIAVNNNSTNFVAMTCSAVGGYTVDWGDGSAPVNVASGVQTNYNYNFNSVPGDAISRGYKQCIVTVTPTTPGTAFTAINLNVRNPSIARSYNVPWLDIAWSAPGITTTWPLPAASNNITMSMLEGITVYSGRYNTSFGCSNYYSLTYVNLIGTTTITSNASFMFNNCSRLVYVSPIVFATVGPVTSTASMFAGCSLLAKAPEITNLAAVTAANAMFSSCRTLDYLPKYNLPAVTNASTMFLNCTALETFPEINFSSVTNASGMFDGCSNLRAISLNFNSATTLATAFQNCFNLEKINLITSTALVNTSSMFNNCSALQTINAFNVTSVTNASTMFGACNSLSIIPAFLFNSVTDLTATFSSCRGLVLIGCLFNSAGTVVMASTFGSSSSIARITSATFGNTFSISNCNLSAAELNEVYTALPTVTGKTITVTGNWGTASDTPSIATAKGWTVTG